MTNPTPSAMMAMAERLWRRRPLDNSADDRLYAAAAEMLLRAESALAALAQPAPLSVPVGWKLVPLVDTEEMWGGLARQIVMWRDMSPHTGAALYRHLKSSGWEIPVWLLELIPDTEHSPPKGAVAGAIYRAMIAAAPDNRSEGRPGEEDRSQADWRRLLRQRDDFIVHSGLWDDFIRDIRSEGRDARPYSADEAISKAILIDDHFDRLEFLKAWELGDWEFAKNFSPAIRTNWPDEKALEERLNNDQFGTAESDE